MGHHCHCLHRYHKLIFFQSRSATVISDIFRHHTIILINHTGITVIMYHPGIITGPILTTSVIINTNPIIDINTVAVREYIQGIITLEITNTVNVHVITGITARFKNTQGTGNLTTISGDHQPPGQVGDAVPGNRPE